MDKAKKLVIPGAFAMAGVEASRMLGAKGSVQQIVAGILGAMVGLYIAGAVAGKGGGAG